MINSVSNQGVCELSFYPLLISRSNKIAYQYFYLYGYLYSLFLLEQPMNKPLRQKRGMKIKYAIHQ